MSYPRTTAEYRERRDEINDQLKQLSQRAAKSDDLDRLAEFLADVPAAWDAATQEQRNKLARCLFDQVWLRNKEVVAVKARAEVDPFFRLNFEEHLKRALEQDTSSRP